MRYLIRGLRNFGGDPAGQALLGVASVVVGTGTVFYRLVEDLRWIDSLYFSVITLTTVGYGDFSPTTNASKIFTIFYVLVGIGIFVALATEIAGHLIEVREDKGMATRSSSSGERSDDSRQQSRTDHGWRGASRQRGKHIVCVCACVEGKSTWRLVRQSGHAAGRTASAGSRRLARHAG